MEYMIKANLMAYNPHPANKILTLNFANVPTIIRALINNREIIRVQEHLKTCLQHHLEFGIAIIPAAFEFAVFSIFFVAVDLPAIQNIRQGAVDLLIN